MTLDPSERLAIVADAARAPSAHNTQPARWMFTEAGLTLLEDTRTRLTVADPSGRDQRIGLGAAVEGMSLALGRRGVALRLSRRYDARETDGRGPLTPIADFALESGADADPLAEWTARRQTFRGRFSPASRPTAAAVAGLAARTPGLVAVTRHDEIVELAKLHDRCIYELMRRSAYQRELYGWMRFSPADPRWHRDGLTTDCMALGAVETKLVRLGFSPPVYAVAKRLGLGRAVVSEAAQVESAAAVLILRAPADEDALDAGRRLYRLWLELTALGIAACPLSATADSDHGSTQLRDRWPPRDGWRITNLLRVGPAPTEPGPPSRRLPADELLVAPAGSGATAA